MKMHVTNPAKPLSNMTVSLSQMSVKLVMKLPHYHYGVKEVLTTSYWWRNAEKLNLNHGVANIVGS